MKKIMLCTLIVSTLGISACSKPEDKTAVTVEQNTSAAVSQNPSATATASDQLNWVGDYKGVLPCADCAGIETELELKADQSYELSEEYLGKQSNEFKAKGRFSFDADQSNVIRLDSHGQERKFLIGENFVELLDMQTGKTIQSELNYKLMKEIN